MFDKNVCVILTSPMGIKYWKEKKFQAYSELGDLRMSVKKKYFLIY